MFKVCIISCGMITNSAHIPAYRHFDDEFEIVAVCDINEKSAKDTAEKHGIAHYYTNAEEMLKVEKPDVVSVCVPNCFHKEYTMLALSMGCNVLCEKPLAFTKADAEEMFEYAKKQGKLLMACQSMRYTPDRLAAKEYIDKKGCEGIYYGELSRIRRRGIPTWGTFHIGKISCGGAFVDIGVHILDALIWLMGNPKIKSVKGIAMQNHKYETGSLIGSGARTGSVDNARIFNPEEMDVEDFSTGTLYFENGATVSFKVAWATNMPEASDIVLVGKDYGIDTVKGKILFGEDGEETIEQIPCPYDVAFPGHIYIVENLLGVLKGKEQPAVTPEETINVATILELFYKSASSGKEEFASKL